MRAFAQDILAQARKSLGPDTPAEEAVHDFRVAMKRWRAFLRLLEPFLGEDGRALRVRARDLAKGLAGARDAQSALDAFNDLGEILPTLSARSAASIRERLEQERLSAQSHSWNQATRGRLIAALTSFSGAVAHWPVDALTSDDLVARLTRAYRRTRRLIPSDWKAADVEHLHELRQRVVEHRYQMEIIEPLWPKLARMWIDEAQRVRNRLGSYNDLVLLAQFAAPHRPLAPWRSRLIPLVVARQAEHLEAAARFCGRLFAEKPKSFHHRLQAIWDAERLKG